MSITVNIPSNSRAHQSISGYYQPLNQLPVNMYFRLILLKNIQRKFIISFADINTKKRYHGHSPPAEYPKQS